MASCIRLARARDRARKPVIFGVKYISILNQRVIAKPRCKIARAINILFFERSCVKGTTQKLRSKRYERDRNYYSEKNRKKLSKLSS